MPGERGEYGRTTCMVRDPGDTGPLCGRAAPWHVLLEVDHEGHHCTLMCLEHFQDARRKALDYHPTGPDCNMPSTAWVRGESPGWGHCEVRHGRPAHHHHAEEHPRVPATV